MSPRPLWLRRRIAPALVVMMLAVLGVAGAPTAYSQSDVVINEVVSANSAETDDFGETSDWIELLNTGAPVNLAGWSLSDAGATWTFPSIDLGTGARLVIWASDRDLTTPSLHTNFKLSATQGEVLILADATGLDVDTVTVPPLADDQAFGRDESTGELGVLESSTFNAANTALAPPRVTLVTAPQVFQGSFDVVLSAPLEAGQSLRYTLDGAPVTGASPSYDGPVTISTSTVVRAAVTNGGAVGPETSGGFTAISAAIADRTSDLPLVLVHSTGAVGTTDQDAIVTVVDRGIDGRAAVTGTPQFTGFAGLRIRGDSSSAFPKKQYKFELWQDPNGTSLDFNLLGLGADDDWNLYAPGRYDRAMINNSFMYELGHQVGVLAPDYQFVELYLEDNTSGVVGAGDYAGLYLLRETIEIDDERVDVTPHTPMSAGEQGGYIIRHDRPDDCCATIHDLPNTIGLVAIDDPKADELTTTQFNWIDGWWDDMRAAADTSYSAADNFLDMESMLDHWLLIIFNRDPDGLRLSHYMHKDAFGQLQGGPLWDFDRTMGSADSRNDELSETTGWDSYGGNGLINLDFYGDLWAMPEVQAALRARWQQWRAGPLSDGAISALIDQQGAEIAEAYTRELGVWNDGGATYGTRFGSLQGELDFMRDWLFARAAWLDGQFSSSSTPDLVNPGTITGTEQQPIAEQLQVSGGTAFSWSHTDLPAGLTLDDTGLLSGTVPIGDGGSVDVTVTVTNNQGGSDSETFRIEIATEWVGGPAPIILNEYNAVGPGRLLDNAGTDTTFGRVGGNGGDWFEVVTIEDDLDLRNYRFDIFMDTASGVRQTASLRLGTNPALNGLRAGTIITIAESVPEDLSYDPAGGDWTINLAADNAQSGSWWSNQTDFDTNHQKWRLVIRDGAGDVRAPVAGETKPWDDANLGVSDTEVFALLSDPTATPDPVIDYGDTVASTFGAANDLGGGVLQNFSALRPDLAPVGEMTCDGTVDLLDALMIAQVRVGLRTDAGQCPLPDPLTQANLSNGDLNRDGSVDLLDSLTIARCFVGIDTGFCEE